ncbi:uncharacterized protein LOC111114887 isoform X1 [Crassostrea virginica]
MDPLTDEAAMSCELRISYMIYVARFNQIGIFFNSSLKDHATNGAQQGTGCRKGSTPRIHCWTTQPPTINTPRDEDADGAHTKDTPMDDTAHGSPTRMHCWTTQLLTTHPVMRMQNIGPHTNVPTMDDIAPGSTRRIHCWTTSFRQHTKG